MRLDGRQLKQIRDIVSRTYDYERLEQDLYLELDRRLQEITKPADLPTVVFRVLVTAQKEGWLRELLRMLQNGQYPDAKEIASRMLGELDSQPNGATVVVSVTPTEVAPQAQPAAQTTNPFEGPIAYPWQHPEADQLYTLLVRDVPAVAQIDILYKKTVPQLPPLNLNQAPALVWKDALEQIATAGALLTLCQHLVGLASAPAVQEAAKAIVEARLPAATNSPEAASIPVDPYLAYLVGQRLFIDRQVLRTHVKDLLSDSPSRVLVVTGDRPCGKSYTWFYVMHVKQHEPDLVPVLIDLNDWADNASRPIDVMSSIALTLGLPEPTVDEHAQGAAQAQRLRDWLVGQLHNRHAQARWLLVFDSLDHVAQRDDTLQLIEYLAGAAIRQRLPGLRVILLGYGNRLPIDPFESVLTEQVDDIGEPELRDFFQTLARDSQVPIAEDAIDIAVQGVLNLLPAERDMALRQLPRTVQAVANAAFGRKVLQ